MTHITFLARGLQEQGHQTVITSSSDIPKVLRIVFCVAARAGLNRLFPELGTVVSSEICAILLSVLLIVRCIRYGADVINAQSVYCARFLHKISRLFRARFVLTVHGYAVFEPISQNHISASGLAARHFAQLETRTFSKADAVVAVDTRIADYVREMSARREVIVRRNFLDIDAYSSARDQRRALDLLGLPQQWRSRPLILCPRRLVPKNGVENAIRSMLDVRMQQLGALLVVVGSGQEGDILRSLVAECNLENFVLFAGKRDHATMPLIYPAAKCVVVPSVPVDGVEEATSLAVLEAMASGIPVIGSAIGGIRELITDGETGLQVPPWQPQALAEAIFRILTDESFAVELSRRAARFVQQRHDYRLATREFLLAYGAV